LRALCALLHQLFSRKPRLLKYAIPDFRSNGTELPKLFSKLWGILEGAAADLEAGEIICILDALDECKESDRLMLIDILRQFYGYGVSTRKEKTALKFLITSRPYFDIERRFKQLTKDIPTIRLAGEDETASISQEIDIVIKAKVQNIASDLGLKDSVSACLEEDLLQITHRTYLWLKLIIDVIYKRLEVTTKIELRQVIRTIPATVDDAYEEILKHSPDISRARKLLHIVVSADRPLTLKEMNVALAIKNESRSREDLDLKQEGDFKTTVTNLCGLFVTVFDSKVYLIHQTAKEFLVKNDSVQPLSLGLWKHSLEPMESNLILAEICIWYLLFTVFESHPLTIAYKASYKHEEIKAEVDRYTNEHDFLNYAAKHWAAHFRGANISDGTQLFKSALEISNTRSKRFFTWFQVFWPRRWPKFPKNSTSLMVGSYFGHEKVVQFLLKTGADIKAKTSSGDTALYWAAEQGHQKVVQLLLENGVDADTENEDGFTPLMSAATMGHTTIAKSC
jgi:ankyrin repeat domain-containing protein 50